MFSFGGRKKDTSTKNNVESDDFNFDIPNLEGEEELSETFEETDLNDPDLLKELQALSGFGVPKEKPKNKPKPAVAPNYLEGLDLEALQNIGEEEDVEVELTEEDFNDPTLLNELSAFGVEPGVDENQTLASNKVANIVPKVEVAHEAPNQLEKNDMEVDEPISEPTKSKTKEELPTDTLIPETFSSSKESDQIDDVSNTSTTHTDKMHPAVSTSLVDLSEPTESTPSESVKPDTSELVELIKQRVQEFKQAALFYKRQGDLATARSMLATSKSLQQPLDILSLGGQLDNDFEIPTVPVLTQPIIAKEPETVSPKPSKVVAKPSPAKAEPKKESKGATIHAITESFDLREVIEDPIVSQITSKSREEQYFELEKQLEHQVSLCTSIAAHYYKSGEKASALQFHKSKKNFLADLASLRSYKEHQRPVPRFHYQEITYVVENAFYDIPVNEMEFEIVRAFHLGVKEISGNNIDAYVSFDICWPTEGTGPGKGDTAVIRKSMDPEFQFQRRIPIERTRPFQRYVERKKATFEVFHYRGFLWKAVSLGKIQVKLDRLLSRCEIHEVMELLDANRRPTGGKLEIKIRLRNPLLKADIMSKAEKWLFLEFDNNSNGSTSVSQAPNLAPAPASAQIPVASDKSPNIESPPIQPAEVKTKTDPIIPANTTPKQPPKKPLTQSNPPPSEEPDELQLATDDFNSAEKLVSNMVLEQELQLVQARISQLREPTEELLDRQQALEIKMNMLVIQVQTGKLTMEGYLDQVKEAIKNTKRLALIFKNHQKMDLAKQALGRIKVMTQEVQEAESAMAEGLME